MSTINKWPWSAGEKLEAESLVQALMPTYTPLNLYSGYTGGFAFDAANNRLYLVESSVSLLYISRFDLLGSGMVSNSGNADNYIWLSLSATYQDSKGDCAVLGDYLYLWAQKIAGGAWKLLRITLADGTATEMTFSGTAPAGTGANAVATDGTYLYISDRDTTTVNKYSVSGTTATFQSAITMPDKVAYGLATDGVNFWFFTDDADNTKNGNIYKTTMAGATVSNRKLRELMYSSTAHLEVIGKAVYGRFMGRLQTDNSGNLSPVFQVVEFL